MILDIGCNGVPLKDIIDQLGNKNYEVIECRCLWKDSEGNDCDDLFGYCKYVDGQLEALDGDLYSLDDLYVKWEERYGVDEIILTVWEEGYVIN